LPQHTALHKPPRIEQAQARLDSALARLEAAATRIADSSADAYDERAADSAQLREEVTVLKRRNEVLDTVNGQVSDRLDMVIEKLKTAIEA